MKVLSDYVITNNSNETLEKIDDSLLCESLQSSILKNVAKQLLDQYNSEAKKDWSYRKNNKFNEIFGRYCANWSEIKDEDIEKIEVPEDATKNDKIVRSVIRSQNDSLIIAYNEQDKKFICMADVNGTVKFLTPALGYRAGESTRWGDKDITQREKVELFRGNTLYIIKNFDKFRNEGLTLRREREDAKRNIVDMSPEGLKKIAQENVKRYKEIIAKNKFMKNDDKELIDDVKNVLDKVTELVTTVAKDPTTYIDVLSDITDLNRLVYDTQQWDRKTGNYYGVNGLLPTMSEYVEVSGSFTKDSYWTSNEYKMDKLEKTKDKLNKALHKAKALIGKIETKMGVE